MNADRFARNLAFLREMGVAPLWVRRNAEPIQEPDVALVEQETVAHAVQELGHARAEPEAAQETREVAREVRPEVPDIAPQARMPAPAEAPADIPMAPESAWDDVPVFPPEPESVPLPPLPDDIPEAPGPRIGDMGWEELAQAVAGCTRCGLCRGRTRTVFGVGARATRWLFIGEGPGREEDLRGEPFVGRAGQLLDNMLAALGLNRAESAYIANIVKCRPTDERGKDRRPSPEETAACLPYLKRQIELIRPEIIVALGKTAAVSLLDLDPETPVSGLRGKVHRYRDVPLIVTYHPAYLLRTPADKKKAWADLCLARATLA